MESLDYKLCMMFLSLLFYHEWWSLLLFFYEWWTLLLSSSSVGGHMSGMNLRELFFLVGRGVKRVQSFYCCLYNCICVSWTHICGCRHTSHKMILSHLSTRLSPCNMAFEALSFICGCFTGTQFNFQHVCISIWFVCLCKMSWWLWSTQSYPFLEL